MARLLVVASSVALGLGLLAAGGCPRQPPTTGPALCAQNGGHPVTCDVATEQCVIPVPWESKSNGSDYGFCEPLHPLAESGCSRRDDTGLMVCLRMP